MSSPPWPLERKRSVAGEDKDKKPQAETTSDVSNFGMVETVYVYVVWKPVGNQNRCRFTPVKGPLSNNGERREKEGVQQVETAGIRNGRNQHQHPSYVQHLLYLQPTVVRVWHARGYLATKISYVYSGTYIVCTAVYKYVVV